MMKKHLSVFGLYARGSIYKILGILSVTFLAEALLFIHGVRQTVTTYHELLRADLVSLSDPERVVEQSGLFLCFAIALVLITAVLCLPGCAFGSQTGYTLRRLRIGERATFFHQATYNILVYLFFLATQAVVLFFLGLYYTRTVPEAFVTNQTLFLAFYRNEFLHAVLPLSDWTLWLRNAFTVAALGFCAAEFPYRQRRGGYALAVGGLVLYFVVFFRQEVGDLFHCMLTLAIDLAVIGETLYTVYRRGKEGGYEDA